MPILTFANIPIDKVLAQSKHNWQKTFCPSVLSLIKSIGRKGNVYPVNIVGGAGIDCLLGLYSFCSGVGMWCWLCLSVENQS